MKIVAQKITDSRRRLARPARSGAPTKEVMRIYRQSGEREYQAVLRAKAVEESTASVENLKVDLTSSQCSEIDDEIFNIPASPAKISMGSAMRLRRAAHGVAIPSRTSSISCL